MNEDKKSKYDYFNPSVSGKEQSAQELYASIYSYIKHTTLKPGDWIALDKLLKQLKGAKNNLPRKVLRSIANKFENIKKPYQR